MAGVATRAIRAIVTGDVQGVGFRWFVRERARQLNLAGWVRNRDDGAVEAAVSGPADDVERLITLLRTGPRAAEVADVRVVDGSLEETYPVPFDIQR